MTLAELIPSISALPRADKLQLIQRLAADLVTEEQLEALSGKTVEYWSPHDSFQAAATLDSLLQANPPAS